MAEHEHPAVILLTNAYQHLREGYEHREKPTVTLARLLKHFSQMPDEFNAQTDKVDLSPEEKITMLQVQIAALTSISAISANYLILLERQGSVRDSLIELHAFIADGIEEIRQTDKLVRTPAAGGMQ